VPETGPAPAVRVGDPTGPYRRRIRIVSTEPGLVNGGLEDDFHSFEVALRHDGGIVTRVDATSHRWPWTTCPDAGAQLHALEGMELSPRCTAVARVTDPRWNCTHQFDLAGLCVAHAGRNESVRQYDVEIPPVVDGETHPRLWRDGELVHDWTLSWEGRSRRLVDPLPFSDAPWQGGFIRWADEQLSPLDAEAAIVLRRSCEIAMGRGMDLEAYETAADIGPYQAGVCYTQQPSISAVAFRTKGTIRDFALHPDALLADE
jgi:Protein of unknown function (DUF2889)